MGGALSAFFNTLSQLSTNPTDANARQAVLTSANNLGTTFSAVANELHRQYALAFTPQTFDGKTHRLEVRVRPPGWKAHARRTYGARPDDL